MSDNPRYDAVTAWGFGLLFTIYACLNFNILHLLSSHGGVIT
jgi:hypothetical protein